MDKSTSTALWIGAGGAFAGFVWWVRRAGSKAAMEAAVAEGESTASASVLTKLVSSVVGAWKWFSRPSTPNLQETDIWYSLDAPIKSDAAMRSAIMLESIIDQFSVERNPRYAPRVLEGGKKASTFCNIFVQDVARAMGVDLPWGNANTLVDYLGSSEAASAGWWKVTAAEAQASANAGQLVVTAWANPGGTGHVQVVRPGAVTAGGPTVAQAGAANYASGTAAKGVGTARLSSLVYYAHA